MKQNFFETQQGQRLQRRYHGLREQMAELGWLTHGSVTPNHPGHWRWTTKVKSKTVTLSLSEPQAKLFKQAIANHRKLEAILRQMRRISQEFLLKSAPGITKKNKNKNRPKAPLS